MHTPLSVISRRIAALCLLFSLHGCLDVESSTDVREDGSLLRTVEVKGDSEAIANGRYGFRFDDGWTRTLLAPVGEKPRFIVTRTFASAEELTRALDHADWRSIAVRASLQKRFRWFTTTYEYRETWRRFHTFNDAPMLDSAQRDALAEALRLRKGDANGSDAEDSIFLALTGIRGADSLLEKNSLEALYRIFAEGMRRAGVPDDTLRARKPQVLADLTERRADKDSLTVEHLRLRMAGHFPEALVTRAFALVDDEMRRYVEMIALRTIVSMCDYQVRVSMPGIITETNAPDVLGSRATWKNFKAAADVKDVEMVVESRVLNWWAVIATGIVMLGGLAVILFAAFARRAPRAGQPAA